MSAGAYSEGTLKRGVAALCLWLVGAAAPADEKPSHALSFPAGVEVVSVNVSVVNSRDRFVTNLLQDDFVVLEDGVKQQLMMFKQEELPVSLVILLDMSSSMTANVRVVRHAASRLIGKLRPQDEAQIVEFNDRPNVLQDFTSDRAALLDAIQRTTPRGSTALHNSLYITLKDIQRLQKTEEMRRRAIVLLSDGEDTASMVTDEQVLELARTAEINIYSIMLAVPVIDQQEGYERAKYLLSALARESGAQAFYPTDGTQLFTVYDRIAQELQSQYSIGYIPSNAALDGNWRQILVMTPRDGLRVRHRLGYYAVPDAPPIRAKISDTGSGLSRTARLP
jgi:Ca-activated chloride channel homolog